MKTYNTFCPLFPGFYSTVFQYDGEEDDINSYNGEYGTDFDYDDFEWNYRDYENRVSKAFVNRLETELKQYLPIKIEFENLYSPKEYNFTNDSINVKISVSLPKIFALIKANMAEATEYFKERYTSCSGFISFHSNDVHTWLKKDYIMEKPEHRVGALLDCLCTILIDRDDIYYWTDSEYWIDFSQKEQV